MKLKNFSPTNDYVLVRLYQRSSTASGILLDTPQQDMWMEVLKVGPEMKHIKAGEFVLVSHLAGMEMTFDKNELCMLIQEAYVCATYSPEKTEKQPFYIPKPPPAPEPPPGVNMIDNEGIDMAPFYNQKGDA